MKERTFGLERAESGQADEPEMPEQAFEVATAERKWEQQGMNGARENFSAQTFQNGLTRAVPSSLNSGENDFRQASLAFV